MVSLLNSGLNIKGYSAADLVVGKAAAMLFVKAGIVAVYAKVISKPAYDFLRARMIDVYCDTFVENIINRDGTDICPMEKAVMNIDDVDIAYKLLKDKLDKQKTTQDAHIAPLSQNSQASIKQNAFKRLINHWFDRLLGVYNDKSFKNQPSNLYEGNKTSRDFILNTLASIAFGVIFPVLTIVATNVSGADQAGRFSMAFVVGQLLFFLGNFGVRTYQISDLKEKHSFKDYQLNRILTCVIMVVVGYFYCCIRAYDSEMQNICLGIFIYKAIDALADVYEGRLQQKEKMYLAGVSQGVRSVCVFVFFSIVLFITRSLVVASYAMALISVASFVLVTFPLTVLETPKSGPLCIKSVFELFVNCWPLFAALFLYQLIDNMPKFIMEGFLSYENQLYLNVLYFLSHIVIMLSQALYKPLLVKMAKYWADSKMHKRFNLVIAAIIAAIIVITILVGIIMNVFGITLTGWMYGIDFWQFSDLCFSMLVAGAIISATDFLYQTITILRCQNKVLPIYLVTFVFSIIIPFVGVQVAGLSGTVYSYLIVMFILFVLMIYVYFGIRDDISKGNIQDVQA